MTRPLPPALPWAAGGLLGAAVASVLAVPVWAAAALILLALPLTPRHLAARLLVGLGWGALAFTLAPAEDLLVAVDPDRPLTVLGRVVGDPWEDDDGHLRADLRVERLRQGGRVLLPAAEVRLRLPADGAARVTRGALLRLRGYLGRPPATRNGRGVAPGPWRLYVESPRFVEAVASPPAWQRARTRVRSSLLATLESWRDRDAAALTATLLLGERSALPERWSRALRAWGLAHLTAVSGLHVGIVGLLAWALGAFLPRPARLTLALGSVAAYALLVGPRPSVVRASVMALVALGALVLERPPDALNALAVAVVGMLLVEPRVVLEVGFQLSVAATAGLLALTLPLARGLARLAAPVGEGRRPGWLALALASSLAAQLAVTPLATPLFALLHPSAPAVHLVAVPWLTAALVAGLASLALGTLLGAPWTALPASVAGWPLEVFAELPPGPWAGWPASAGAGAWLLVCCAAAAVLLFAGRLATRARASSVASAWPVAPAWPVARAASVLAASVLAASVLAGSVLAAMAVSWPVLSGAASGGDGAGAEVVVLDVGQGDAVLLRRGDRAVLVDGGGWRHGDLAARVLVPALARLGVRRLEAVVMSHPDIDHCGGLVDLLSYLPAREVWSVPGEDAACAAELLGRRGVRWRPLWRGRRAEAAGWRFDVLGPPPSTAGGRRRLAEVNDRSLVLAARAAGRRLLLTGDIGAEVERLLVAAAPGALRADLLKVAHHGSKSSTTGDFLDAVSPRLALVPVGRGNFYGHPHPSVLGRLEARSIGVLRTDRHGLIDLAWTAGSPLRLRVAAAEPW